VKEAAEYRTLRRLGSKRFNASGRWRIGRSTAAVQALVSKLQVGASELSSTRG